MKDHDEQLLITGGAGDLAQAFGEAFERAGVTVYRPGKSDLDVTDSRNVDEYLNEIGQVDLLICNAGVTDDSLLLKMSEASWDSVMDVNLRGSFLVAKSVARLMIKKRRGHIVFISSHSAYHPPLGQANYGSAKAGLEGLAKSLARELGGRNIRVNVVVPGFMETKMTSKLPDEVRSAALDKHCLGRFNQTDSVAAFVRSLHYEMPNTSGQVFHLDSRIV